MQLKAKSRNAIPAQFQAAQPKGRGAPPKKGAAPAMPMQAPAMQAAMPKPMAKSVGAAKKLAAF